MTNIVLDSMRLTLGAQNLIHPYFNLVILNTIIKQPISVSHGGCTSKDDIVPSMYHNTSNLFNHGS
jgi:hypothetical protein